MSDLKSKMPDLQELSAMAGKFFKDMKVSIDGIIEDYKKKHPSTNASASSKKPTAASKPTEPKKPAVKKSVKEDKH